MSHEGVALVAAEAPGVREADAAAIAIAHLAPEQGGVGPRLDPVMPTAPRSIAPAHDRDVFPNAVLVAAFWAYPQRPYAPVEGASATLTDAELSSHRSAPGVPYHDHDLLWQHIPRHGVF